MNLSYGITKPMWDPALAGEFARKAFGKFGMARIRTMRVPRIGRTITVYEIGTCSQIGEFVLKADSSWDFAECFERGGHPLDARDPLFLRDDIRFINRICEAGSAEQVEIAL